MPPAGKCRAGHTNRENAPDRRIFATDVTVGGVVIASRSSSYACLLQSDNDHLAGSPWRVSPYLDDRASHEQHAALAAIVPGRAGGSTRRNFAAAMGSAHAVWRVRIVLSHVSRRWSIRADTYLIVHAGTPGGAPALVACGIPGFGQPGQEVVADCSRG